MYLGIDLETQGFNAETDAPTEIGVVAFNDKFEELFTLNFLIKSKLTKPQTKEIEEITGISDDMINGQGVLESEVLEAIYPRLKESKAIFAYNAPFDVSFLKALFKRHELDVNLPVVVDVMRDIDYPAKFKCKKLSHLAYDHGVLEHPDNLHRATADVRLMIKLIQKYDLGTMIANAAEPKATLRMMTKGPWEDKGVSNAYAKEKGFHFVPESKIWSKEVRESEVNKLIQESKVPVVRLK